jgi:hypothetical protein
MNAKLSLPYPTFSPSPKGKEREHDANMFAAEEPALEIDNRCIKIRDWYVAFQRAKSSRKLHPKVEGLSHWIQVAGELSEACDGHEEGQAWHSSLIVERLGPRLLKTKSGGLYKLDGRCDMSMMEQKKDFPVHVANRFSEGFPDDWADLLVAEAHRRGHFAPPRNRARGKPRRSDAELKRGPIAKTAKHQNGKHDVVQIDTPFEDRESSEESEDGYRTAGRSVRRTSPAAKLISSVSASKRVVPVKPVVRKPLPRELSALSSTRWGRVVAIENAIMDGIEDSRAKKVEKKRQSLPARLAADDPLTPQAQLGPRSSLTPRSSARKRNAARSWWEVNEPSPPVDRKQKDVLSKAKRSEHPLDLSIDRSQRKARDLRAGKYLTSDVTCTFSDSADEFVAVSTEHDAADTSVDAAPTSQHDETDVSTNAAPTSSPLRFKEKKRLGARMMDDRSKRLKMTSEVDRLSEVFESTADEQATAIDEAVDGQACAEGENSAARSAAGKPQVVRLYSIFEASQRQKAENETVDDELQAGIGFAHTAPSSPASSDVLDNSLHNADIETGITTMSDEEAEGDVDTKAEKASAERDDVAMSPSEKSVDTDAPLLERMSEQVSQMSIDRQEVTSKDLSAVTHPADPIDQDLHEYLVLSSSSVDEPLINGVSSVTAIKDAPSTAHLSTTSKLRSGAVITPRIVYDIGLGHNHEAVEDDEEESLDSDDDDDRPSLVSDEEYYCFSD